jgi:hypothetical protein
MPWVQETIPTSLQEQRPDSPELLKAGNPDFWEKMIQLDLLTPMRLTRHLAPIMAKKDSGGRIINIISILGLQAVKGTAAYNAAKFGMTGWSKSTFEVQPKLLWIPALKAPSFAELQTLIGAEHTLEQARRSKVYGTDMRDLRRS